MKVTINVLLLLLKGNEQVSEIWFVFGFFKEI